MMALTVARLGQCRSFVVLDVAMTGAESGIWSVSYWLVPRDAASGSEETGPSAVAGPLHGCNIAHGDAEYGHVVQMWVQRSSLHCSVLR
jgi:hypothetical protein